MSVHHYPQYPRTRTPTPTPLQRETDGQLQEIRWARIAVFPLNGNARLRYVPVRAPRPGQTRQQALTETVWRCRTSMGRTQVVRIKYAWEASWDYYEIKLSIPIIPGYGRGNAALARLPYCPPFVGEVAVVRRAGHRLNHVVDMRIQDRRKAEVAVISIIRGAMGMGGRYRGGVVVEYMLSSEALEYLQ